MERVGEQAEDKEKRRLIRQILGYYKGNVEQAITDVNREYNLVMSSLRAKYVPPEGAKPILVVENLVRKYKNGKEKIAAVDDVSFKVYEKEIMALTGASGSGKSTLLHLIGGLDKPTSGKVIVDGTDIAKLSDGKLSKFRNQTVGFVFQFFYLQPFLSLAQNIGVPAMVRKGSAKARRERGLELAEAVGLKERMKHLPKELSGGQMQRAAIARALFNEPKILIADEPTGNLDSKNSMMILELFHKVREQFGTTIIIVTHDEKIARMADRRLVMSDGKLIEGGE